MAESGDGELLSLAWYVGHLILFMASGLGGSPLCLTAWRTGVDDMNFSLHESHEFFSFAD